MFCLIIERISLQLDHLLLLLFRGQAECVVRWCWLEPQVLPLIKVTSLLVSAEPPRASLAAETTLGFSSSSCILVSSRMCALLLAVLPIFFLLPNSCKFLSAFSVVSSLFLFSSCGLQFPFEVLGQLVEWQAVSVSHISELSSDNCCHGLWNTKTYSLGKNHSL